MAVLLPKLDWTRIRAEARITSSGGVQTIAGSPQTTISGAPSAVGQDLVLEGFELHYGINAVPTATLLLAVGKNPLTFESAPSVDDVKTRDKITITLKRDANSDKVFDGYVSGVAGSRTSSEVSRQVSAVHWLDDLSVSSAFSDQRSPRALWDLDRKLTYRGLGSSATSKNTFLSWQQMVTALMLSAPAENLWQRIVNISNWLTDSATAGVLGNKLGRDAFDRITGKLTTKYTPGNWMSMGISSVLTSVFHMAESGATLWDMLIAAAGHFGFMIVPTVSKAYATPWLPVAKTKQVSIKADDIVYVTDYRSIKSTIGVMVLYTLMGLPSSGNKAADASINWPVASYPRPRKDGMIDAAPMPEWLSEAVALYQTDDTKADIANIEINGRGPVKTKSAGASSQNTTVSDLFNIGTLWAQLLYCSRKFGQNRATLLGKLRFDITPGMTVSFAMSKHSGGSGAMGTTDTEKVYGFVERVHVYLNADKQNAATVLDITHLRSDVDNSIEALASHPLYKEDYPGAKLLD